MSGSLVGWLFADVALVLMIVFAGSNVSVPTTTTSSSSSTSTTTTTLPSSETTVAPSTTVLEGGVQLEALETGALAIGLTPGDGVVQRLEARLEDLIESGFLSETPERFGVILIYAGAKTDGDVSAAKERACLVRDALLQDWMRIEEGRVYFKCFHDLNLENDFVKFSLFPIIDSSYAP